MTRSSTRPIFLWNFTIRTLQCACENLYFKEKKRNYRQLAIRIYSCKIRQLVLFSTYLWNDLGWPAPSNVPWNHHWVWFTWGKPLQAASFILQNLDNCMLMWHFSGELNLEDVFISSLGLVHLVNAQILYGFHCALCFKLTLFQTRRPHMDWTVGI